MTVFGLKVFPKFYPINAKTGDLLDVQKVASPDPVPPIIS